MIEIIHIDKDNINDFDILCCYMFDNVITGYTQLNNQLSLLDSSKGFKRLNGVKIGNKIKLIGLGYIAVKYNGRLLDMVPADKVNAFILDVHRLSDAFHHSFNCDSILSASMP